MKTLLVLKEHIKTFYGKNEVYLIPVMKFLLALVSLLLINGFWGFMDKINKFPIVLVASLLCSFLPSNFIILIAALFIILHSYALALECAAVVAAVFLLLFLLYFRFSPKEMMVVLFVPLCFALKIPYVMPLVMGLVGTPVSVIPVGCGVIIYHMMAYISGNKMVLGAVDSESASQKFKIVMDGILNNKEMLVTLAAFSFTILLIYAIKRMSVNYSWIVAMLAGAIANVVILFMGDFLFDINISVIGTLFGTVVALGIAKLVQFFVFNVDYSRTEYVQFEDDEYYYYVKAVPKIAVTAPEKSIKKINTQKRSSVRK